MAVAFISLGSNVDDRMEFLRRAVEEMNLHGGIQVLECSSLYRTLAWGYTEQPWFLNSVVKITTTLTPNDLLAALKTIEGKVGRTETFRWGPREIDLDLLVVDDVVMDDAGLSIPHPLIGQRAFVLRPLLDIAPDLCDPRSGRPWKTFWNELSDKERQSVTAAYSPLI